MSDHWYYARGGQQFGPYTPVQLRQLADAGQLLPSDQLWSEGMGVWIEASKASLLFAPQPGAPAPQMPAGGPYPSQPSVASLPQPQAPANQVAAPAAPFGSPQAPQPGSPMSANPAPGAQPGPAPSPGPTLQQPSTAGNGAAAGAAKPTAQSVAAQKPNTPARPRPLTSDDDKIDPKVMIGTALVVVPIILLSLLLAFWPRGDSTEVAQDLSAPSQESQTTDTSTGLTQPTPNDLDLSQVPGLAPPHIQTPPEPPELKTPEPAPPVTPVNPPPEPPKAEPPKTKPPTTEPPKTEPAKTEPPKTEPPKTTEPAPTGPKTTDVPPNTTEPKPEPATEPPPATIVLALADPRLFNTLFDRTLPEVIRATPAAAGAELCVTTNTIELASEDLFQYIDVKNALLKLADKEELRVNPPKNIGGYVTDVALKLPQPLLKDGLDEKRVREILGPPTGERVVKWKIAGDEKQPVTFVTWYDGLLGYANGTFWLNGPKIVDTISEKPQE